MQVAGDDQPASPFWMSQACTWAAVAYWPSAFRPGSPGTSWISQNVKMETANSTSGIWISRRPSSARMRLRRSDSAPNPRGAAAPPAPARWFNPGGYGGSSREVRGVVPGR